jgi:hypothetical protein
MTRPAAPSIVLPIHNERQLENGLCWAACIAPIVRFFCNRTVSQHELCHAAGRRSQDGATTDDMSRALRRIAGIMTYPTQPISIDATRKYLVSGRPLILVVDVGAGFICHTVVLRGLLQDGSAIVNEPNLASGMSLHVAFPRVHAAWRSGLVVVQKI